MSIGLAIVDVCRTTRRGADVFGRLYRHAWDDDRFLYVRGDLKFPVSAFTKRNWKLIDEHVDAADLDLTEDALHRGWYLELRQDLSDATAS